MALDCVLIDTITSNEKANYRSIFSSCKLAQTARGDLWITEQQSCLNFRYRSSPAGYKSDWHVAGDPTLIIISSGCLEIELRDGSRKRFTAGNKFIAEDFLPPQHPFDPQSHGHRARVPGREEFSAIHIKLSKRIA